MLVQPVPFSSVAGARSQVVGAVSAINLECVAAHYVDVKVPAPTTRVQMTTSKNATMYCMLNRVCGIVVILVIS